MTPKLLADRYEVGRLLGAGAMAQVYEGWDRMRTRRVAIKLMNAPLAADPHALKQFQLEAKAAAGLSHPNVVRVYDAGAHDRTAFIVMELAEGYTLRDRLRFGPLPIPAVVEVATQVCAALSAAHERGLIHRDVKPGNIMLTPTGRVKVMDFGIARGGAAETLTHSGMLIGAAQYLAPEQAEGAPVDARSDLYSLGCCLYEMLTGQVPFTGESPVGIALRHVREDPVPPSELNDEIPPAIEQITMRALAKRPSERWQTADELRMALERGDPGLFGAQLSGTATMAAHPPVSGEQTPVPFAPPTLGGSRAATAVAPPARSSRRGDVGAPTMALAEAHEPTGSLPPTRAVRSQPSRGRLTWKVAAATLLLMVLGTTGAAALLRDAGAPTPESELAADQRGGAQGPAQRGLPPTTTAQPAAAAAPEAGESTTTTTQAGAVEAPDEEAAGEEATAEQEPVAPPDEAAPGTDPEVAPQAADGAQVSVPDLVGLSGEEARAAVTDLGLQVNTVGIPTPIERFVGQVIVQRPQAGTLLAPGGQVFLGIGVAEQE